MKVRQAVIGDIAEMSAFLQQLVALGKRTSPADQDFVRAQYISHRDKIQCVVVEDDNRTILGFQALKIASEGNRYGVTPGWGIVGTHVRPDAARRGVGKKLFRATLEAAVNAGLNHIDATISITNIEGLAYYDALGFETYRTPDGSICKCFKVTP